MVELHERARPTETCRSRARDADADANAMDARNGNSIETRGGVDALANPLGLVTFSRVNARRHVPTVMRFSTLYTPGAAQASRAASSLSAQERTVPRRVTLPPSTSTATRRASISSRR